MSMLDSFFNKGFKGAKCKTLLKLTIPRIKLLRNRREIQIKQMRRDIAKLLETGQEATARIRVEHIIREENMMAAQEVLELFCELIAVRLPIIETQRECPLDLKEAISSVCFAAPRCADLPELLQVQMQFATKYGREFVAAASELMPECGVNRQLIELLSVRAPSAEKKLMLLKEIAEDHELDWDPASTETNLFKPQEDLLNGPTQFVSGSKLPLPKEKHDEALNSANDQVHNEETDSDKDFDGLDFPEVPKMAPKSDINATSATGITPSMPAAPHRGIDHKSSGNFPHVLQMEPFPDTNATPDTEITTPMPTAPQHGIDHESLQRSGPSENLSQELHVEPQEEIYVANKDETVYSSASAKEDRQFLPFVSAPSLSSVSFSARQNNSAPTVSRTSIETNMDLQDVLAAAQAAAESAERAATAARTAASLAQIRISELTQKKNDAVSENPFHKGEFDQSAETEKPHLDHQNSSNDPDSMFKSLDSQQLHEDYRKSELPDVPAFDKLKEDFESLPSSDHVYDQEPLQHQPQRLPSMDDDPYFSYPNLFTSQNSNLGSGTHSFTDNTRSTHEV
ncbi:hypothetical protein Q3G72_019867 [Acer saccharum]|nr:hypothetical protein Q3G72_019867 [Acer saccharum]